MNLKLIMKTAYRNLLRNRKRSQLIFFAVTGVVFFVVMMDGFAQFSYQGLQKRFSNSGIGQLQVGLDAAFKSAKPEDHRMSLEQMNSLRNTLSERMLTSRLVRFSGLVGTENGSEVFQGQGVDFSEFMKLSGALHYLGDVTDFKSDDLVLGESLAKKLNVGIGAHVSLLVSMENGRTNVMDYTVKALVQTGSTELDAVTLYASFDSVVSLLRLTKADLIMVHGGDLNRLPELRAFIASKISSVFAIRSWEEICSYYGSVKNLYSRILYMIKLVLAITAILSVSNSLLLSIQERKGELGMLRAIGVSKRQLLGIFGTEGVILGALGAMGGIFLAALTSLIVKVLGGIPMPPPPGSSEGYHLNFILSQTSIVSSVLGAAFCGFASAVYASRSQIAIPVNQLLASILIVALSGIGGTQAYATESPESILRKWDDLRQAESGTYRLNASFDLLDEMGAKKESVMYAVVVTPKGSVAVSVSDPVGQRMVILTQEGGDGMWMQTESMRKAIRVSPSQRLLGQASNADVVNVEWARDYKAFSFSNSVLTLVKKTENAAYAKVVIFWDGVKAKSANYYSDSGKLLKTSQFEYQVVNGKNRLATTLISDAFNPKNKTRVSTSQAQKSELSDQFLNPDRVLQVVRKVGL